MDNPPRANVDTYGFEWPKDFDHEKYSEFMSKYISILSRRARKWDRLLNSKDGFHKSNKVKRYIRKGIPGSHRGTIWTTISEAKQMKERDPDLYKTILKGPLKNEVIETISLDIPRTFPDNIYFKGTSEDSKRQSLYQVLTAFAHKNPQIGYCQGLNFIAGIMLLVTDSEDTTFWLLQSLVENILPDYYTKQMTGLLTDIGVLEELIRSKVPQVHNHMIKMGVSWSMYVSKWFICLFAEVLPIETVLRIWDCLFYEGSKVLLRVAVTLVVKNEARILAATNFVEITEVFKSLPNGAFVTDCHTFMKAIFRTPGSFPRAHIIKLREWCRERIVKEQEQTQLMAEQAREKQAIERAAREAAQKEQREREEREAAEKAKEETESATEEHIDQEGASAHPDSNGTEEDAKEQHVEENVGGTSLKKGLQPEIHISEVHASQSANDGDGILMQGTESNSNMSDTDKITQKTGATTPTAGNSAPVMVNGENAEEVQHCPSSSSAIKTPS